MRKTTNESPRQKSNDDDELPVTPVAKLKKFRSFVLYGRSGTGKTTLASTFPGPLLLLDVKDEGTDSVSDVPDLDVMDVASLEDFERAYWWLKKHPKKYKTVIIDTVSQLQSIAVQEIAGDKAKGKKKAGDWGSMTKRDWADVAAVMKEWLVNYRDLSKLGINVVFIAQDRVFNFNEEDDAIDEGMLAPEVGPGLSPSIAKTLNAAVSMIGNTFIRTREVKKEVDGKKVTRRKTEYCLRVGPSPVYITKVRKPREYEAPELIVNPDYDKIMDIIQGD